MATSTAVPDLYMVPSSYYSQKVRLALREKGINHKETLVNMAGDLYAPWYLRLNPNGQVPMLKIGDKYLAESDTIIETVDRLPSESNVKLVPDESTPEGKAVAAWRERLNNVDVANLTFGIMLHPELSIDGMIFPKKLRPTKEGMKAKFATNIRTLEQMQEQNPDLKTALEKKIQSIQARNVSFFDKNICMKVMNGLDALMDDIDKQLEKNAKSENSPGHWLCTQNLTAADITLCVLLGRLRVLGVLSRYAVPSKRPHLCAYWNMAMEQPHIKAVILDNIKETQMHFMKQKIKKVLLITTGVGLVSAGIWLAYKHLSKK